MTTGNNNKIQRGIQNRKTDQERIGRHAVKLFKVSGRVQVIGDGECSFPVDFPVTFSERPGFSHGYELAENQILVAGAFPVVSVGVALWKRVPTHIPGEYNYTGAVITAVAQDNPSYLWVHWHVEGTAFQNPINNLSTSDPVV